MKSLSRLLRRKSIRYSISGLAVLMGSYWLMMCYPQLFFHSSVSSDTLVLYSDKPFAPEAAKAVLEKARAKLSASPLYVADQQHLIFVCNERWRQRLFFNYTYGVGGVNFYPFTTNVFVRDSIIEENCLISPRGERLPEPRTLDYFIAHEIAHTLMGQFAGAVDYHSLPKWIPEGYADYVGKGAAFDYEEHKRAYLAGEELEVIKAGVYWRYHVMVSHLLDRKGWTVQRLLEEPIDEKVVEASIRNE